jgi:hypothetical protein
MLAWNYLLASLKKPGYVRCFAVTYKVLGWEIAVGSGH